MMNGHHRQTLRRKELWGQSQSMQGGGHVNGSSDHDDDLESSKGNFSHSMSMSTSSTGICRRPSTGCVVVGTTTVVIVLLGLGLASVMHLFQGNYNGSHILSMNSEDVNQVTHHQHHRHEEKSLKDVEEVKLTKIPGNQSQIHLRFVVTTLFSWEWG